MALNYWEKKGENKGDISTPIDWSIIGRAINKMPFSHRWFLSKHTSGMCGVGIFTTIWEETETMACPMACPRCGHFEDSDHIWACKAPAVQPL